MNKWPGLLAAAILISGAVAALAAESLPAVIDGQHRSAENKTRDRYRHPAETLAFFDVQDDMTVVEIWPGAAGWYTEILAPYLKDKGMLYAAHFSPASSVPYFRNSLEAFRDKIAAAPEIYGQLQLSVLQPPDQLAIAPPGSADRVLTFRNVHNWMKSGQAETVFKAMYDALKPGGVLGVVEHRGTAGLAQDPEAASGYVREDTVIALAENAGFRLLAKSEINANPKDSGKHPKGVWSLPPSLREGEANRDAYLAVGESDRMTLKFLKPGS